MKNIIVAGTALLAVAGVAFAAETTTYEYDAQGRLIKSSKSGGPVSGTEKCTSYDPAGNRTNQTVNTAGCAVGSSSGGSSGGGSSGGSSGGGGSNNPPVAVADFLVSSCNYGMTNVLLNDSDPDAGDTITAISVGGGMGATISGGSTVTVTAATTGTLTYTIQDNHGATASSTISVIYLCGPFF